MILSLLALLAACGEPTPTWYTDVKPIVDGRCTSCHSDGGVAPFSLESYAEAQPWAGQVGAAVSLGTMPPWGATDAVAYANDRSLTPEQIDTLVRWAEDGAPEGDPAEEGPPLEVAVPELARVDAELAMVEHYEPAPAEGSDDYRCFVLDWPEETTTYVTGFHPRPGNRKVVHHVAAFLVRPDTLMGEEVFDQLAAWDEEVEGPGYTCFGGPGGSSDLQVPIQQLAQWVPGAGAVVLPEGTGIEVPAGSKVVLQLHYHVAADAEGERDLSTIDLQLADTVARKGAFAPWLDGTWPLGNMTIHAGEEVTHEKVGDPRAFFGIMTDLDLDRGFVIYTAMLHMHRLGVHAETWLERSDGTAHAILELPDYDFDWQLTYELAEPLPFEDGDALGVSCTWDNGSGGADIGWGEGTDDEMCVANLYISEP